MLNARILLVSDDHETGQIWAYGLNQRGLQVVQANPGEDLLASSTRDPVDLVLINVYGSQMDGVKLCRQIRAEVVNPILLFTHDSDERRILEAYEAGVDECIVKPIGLRLFLAKVTAWLRRSWTVPAEALEMLQVGGLRLDPAARQLVTTEGETVKLTNLEFRLLHLLMNHPGQVLDSSLIIDRVWGNAQPGDSNLLKNVVYRLRRKIEPHPSQPRYLQTVSGGYRFQAR